MAGKEQFSGSVSIRQEETFLGNGSVYGMQTIGIAAVEIKVGADKLASRSVVYLCTDPNNTGTIYIGLDNLVTASKWFLALTAGQGITIALDPLYASPIYAIGSAAGQKLGILDGKN